ncbi:MAG: radical SAM protein [Promethearchaeota archaeon]
MFSNQAIKMKAKMLCQGVNVDQSLQDKLDQQNPSKIKRGGLSSGGKFFLIEEEKKLPVNAPIYHKRKSSIQVTLTNDNTLIVYDEESDLDFAIELIKPPNWYWKFVDSFPITSILTAHNKQLASAVYEDCTLFYKGKPCKFCVMKYSQRNPDLIFKSGKLLIKALSKIPLTLYKGLTLNGGMTYHPGRGMEIIEPVVREIHQKFPKLPIAVEITPPKNLDWINKIVNAGASSLMMNLECWEDKLRKKVIPSKNQLCSKEMYLRAFDRVLECLGEGRVSTCFVMGIETVDSLKTGIREVISRGVIPSLLAGRYFEDIPNYPFIPDVNWREFLEVVYFTASEMKKQKITSCDQAGCIACGMCDLIKNLM